MKTGERRLTVLLDRYGPETVEEGIVELKARSERQMRACIESVPDGVYCFTSYIDSDDVRFFAIEPAVPRPDELRLGNDPVRGLCRDEAHLP